MKKMKKMEKKGGRGGKRETSMNLGGFEKQYLLTDDLVRVTD